MIAIDRRSLAAVLVAIVASCLAWLFGPDATPSSDGALELPALNTPTQLVLASLSLASTDLLADERLSLELASVKLKTPTLSLCGADFPSESERLVRRRTGVTAAGQPVSLLSDVTQYSSSAAALQALAELRDAIAGCAATEFSDLAVGAELPADALAKQWLAADGATALGYWQVRGNVLVSLQWQSTGPDANRFAELVAALQQRLAAVDPVEIGYF